MNVIASGVNPEIYTINAKTVVMIEERKSIFI